MARFTIALLMIAAVVLVADGASERRCGKNEQYNSCGTACPPTCSNPDPQICTLQCKIGCECKQGYLLNSKNECVKPKDC